ncbi:MAG: ATP-binding cassette, subfamily bacterial, partial [Acidimicrobiaceae bacterium]|nr:ATP-binding cassette, subfamily bacterial [Acidimicrobiaceae bacterium]
MSRSRRAATGRDLTTWAAGLRVAGYRKSRYIPVGSLWVLMHSLPVLSGLVLKAVFDRVSQGGSATSGALPLLAVFVAAEAGRAVIVWGALVAWPSWWQWVAAWMRANLLSSVLVAPGSPAARMPGSAGEAVARFRDDVEDVVWFVDLWVDVAGGVVFTVAAVVIMLAISPLVTIVAVLPLVVVATGTRALSRLIRRYHGAERASGSSVTAFVADLFAGILTLKTAGAEAAALDRFRQRNAARADAAVKAQLCRDLLMTVSGASVDISIGLVLLLSAPAMRAGRFTVGDLALFTTYASWLTGLPRWAGRMMARQREATVSFQRLARIDAAGRVDGVLAERRVDLRTSVPPPQANPGPRQELASFEACGLSVAHPDGRRGIEGVDLRVERGSFTVVTGAVGSGKTTLVRGLLGLTTISAGELRWNGEVVGDPSVDLQPPRIAYVGQVPRLLSASLDENLRLGWPATEDEVAVAIDQAQLGGDVADLVAGLATRVGPRGSRLSGGQAQRATLARALLRRPELLVIDDASSALDVETEAALWQALSQTGITCLAVSHR